MRLVHGHKAELTVVVHIVVLLVPLVPRPPVIPTPALAQHPPHCETNAIRRGRSLAEETSQLSLHESFKNTVHMLFEVSPSTSTSVSIYA